MEVSRYNLKLFIPHHYPTVKIDILRKLMDHIGFDFDHQSYDRLIFRYRIEDISDYEIEQTCIKKVVKELLNEITDDVLQNYQDYLFFAFIVQEIVDNSIQTASKKEIYENRKKIITVFPNEYLDAGYFTLPGGFRCYVKKFKDAIYWKTYRKKYYTNSDPLEDVVYTTVHFRENTILPGGQWVDGYDDFEFSMFYPPPPELIEPNSDHLSISPETILLDIHSTTPSRDYAMLNFYNMDKKQIVSRLWTIISSGGTSISELHHELHEKVTNYERKFEGQENIVISLEKIDIQSDKSGNIEYTIEYRCSTTITSSDILNNSYR